MKWLGNGNFWLKKYVFAKFFFWRGNYPTLSRSAFEINVIKKLKRNQIKNLKNLLLLAKHLINLKEISYHKIYRDLNINIRI